MGLDGVNVQDKLLLFCQILPTRPPTCVVFLFDFFNWLRGYSRCCYRSSPLGRFFWSHNDLGNGARKKGGSVVKRIQKATTKDLRKKH
jgi:hypothetical protein